MIISLYPKLASQISKIAGSIIEVGEHEGSYPKPPIHKSIKPPSCIIDPSNNPWHQIPNDYQIAHGDSKAFDCNSCVKNDRSVGIRDVREGKVRRGSAFQVPSASRLEIKTKTCRHGGPHNDQYPNQDAHSRKREGHRKDPSAKDYGFPNQSSILVGSKGWSILVLRRFITLLAQLACPIVPISFRPRLERRLHRWHQYQN